MSFGRKWQKFHKEYLFYHAKISSITLKGLLNDIKTHHSDSLCILPLKLFLLLKSRESILSNLLSLESTWNNDNGDRYVSFTEAGMYMFPKEWFEEYIMMPFEDVEVRISKYYHEYLTYIYGDYMTPPPPEKRHGDGPHGKLYINLDEKIPMEKVKRLVR